MRVLVTGGAGYIGSHACDALLNAGHSVSILDNLSRGHKAAVEILARRAPGRLAFIQGDTGDPAALDRAFDGGVDAVMHFAAFANVGESAADPVLYYRNNVGAMIPLAEAIRKRRVTRIVYSSSCSVYGQPPENLIPLHESAPLAPLSPYGRTKLIGEQILQDVVAALAMDGEKAALTCLRYFNVAGCEPRGELGEDHEPELHLLPVVLRAAMSDRPSMKLFGTDYPTPDGTCVRDYAHVCDIADAHVRALERISPGETVMLNLGLGRGISNREIIDAAQRVTGRTIKVEAAPRREGDPAQLFANPMNASARLGWSPRFTKLEEIVETAWKWFSAHPRGYRA
ncbi:MAG: UDP-glucose 4-epimerase GalE [Phycisphaeraceae bacterium]|nr:UDP-glucose 4-epimerase GalE [Phycisphaeraceae bacterium]